MLPQTFLLFVGRSKLFVPVDRQLAVRTVLSSHFDFLTRLLWLFLKVLEFFLDGKVLQVELLDFVLTFFKLCRLLESLGTNEILVDML